ncbi:MAG: hypothetical protein ACAH89_13065 [Rariglobus sp.]
MGWITDFFRFAWSLLYWNARKSAYRLRGTRGRCPCHHPSDSGRAWETACAAITHWNDPARFQRVCPLLKQNASGAWRCTADRADVRPFWGRAAGFYGSALLVVYLTATLGAFVFLRSVGYGVTYPGVLWPPAWKKFHGIRGDYFLKKYQDASKAGDLQAALMALSTAYSLDPQNYAAGRQLALVWQISQPLYSNQIYRRLLQDHPGQAAVTAQVWFRALLARGDFEGVEILAADRILASPENSTPWINAFLFANRRTANAATRVSLLSNPSTPPSARWLLTLTEDLAKLAKPADIRGRLLVAASNAGDGLSFYHVCRELISRGFPQEALEWMDRRPGLLGQRDLIPLRLDALSILRWGGTLQNEVKNLLFAPPSPIVVELLSAHLIRHPDATVRALIFDRVEQTPAPSDSAGLAAHLALFCAAGTGHDIERMNWTALRIKASLGGSFPGLDAVAASLIDGERGRRLENYLPALQPLSLEVTYALLDHYAPAR